MFYLNEFNYETNEFSEKQYNYEDCFYNYSFDFKPIVDKYGTLLNVELKENIIKELEKAGFSSEQIKILNKILSGIVYSSIELFVERTQRR